MKYDIDYTKYATNVIRELIKEKRGAFVLYPFGERGKLVKSILNVYFGIQEFMIVDNILAKKFPMIKTIADLAKEDLTDVTVLITSNNNECYDEIRETLYDVVPQDKCFELFPRDGINIANLNYKEYPLDLYFQMRKISTEQSARYIMDNMSSAKRFKDRYEMLEYLIWEKLVDESGLFLEFGVYRGESINFTSIMKPTHKFYGFDSFEGLPENWSQQCKKGTFDVDGVMPKVNSNVELIKGWFDETLPKFLEEHKEKCSFIHIDSDIYSSAKIVLDLLKDRIVSETIIEFDEYFNYPCWQQHEYKAFQEFVKENRLEYDYIGYANNGPQVSVIIR